MLKEGPNYQNEIKAEKQITNYQTCKLKLKIQNLTTK